MKRMAIVLLVDVTDDTTMESMAEDLAASIEHRGVFSDTKYGHVTLDSVGEHEASKKAARRSQLRSK